MVNLLGQDFMPVIGDAQVGPDSFTPVTLDEFSAPPQNTDAGGTGGNDSGTDTGGTGDNDSGEDIGFPQPGAGDSTECFFCSPKWWMHEGPADEYFQFDLESARTIDSGFADPNNPGTNFNTFFGTGWRVTDFKGAKGLGFVCWEPIIWQTTGAIFNWKGPNVDCSSTTSGRQEVTYFGSSPKLVGEIMLIRGFAPMAHAYPTLAVRQWFEFEPLLIRVKHQFQSQGLLGASACVPP